MMCVVPFLTPFMYMSSADFERRTGVLIWVLARKRKEESQGLFLNCLVLSKALQMLCWPVLVPLFKALSFLVVVSRSS